MIEIMMFLTLAPVISLGVAIVAMVIAAFATGEYSTSHSIDIKMPDGEEYKRDKVEHEPNPTIAEQFDGRLTNIVRNPWEGIL